MPLYIKPGHPAINELSEEGIKVFTYKDLKDSYAFLKIGLLNLMPLKQRTEKDFFRLLSNTDKKIKLDLIETSSYRGTHTSSLHLDAFYTPWDAIKHNHYDGFIVTGAPVEEMDFEEVKYWEEICRILEWCNANVRASLFICWGAQAALYHYYNVQKYKLKGKLSGVYEHRVNYSYEPLMEGITTPFNVPHSRNTAIAKADISICPDLRIIAESDEAGVHCVMNIDGTRIFLTGHSEYASDTLDFEYHRDLQKGLSPNIPQHYYVDDNPINDYVDLWKKDGRRLFANWINHYVHHSN